MTLSLLNLDLIRITTLQFPQLKLHLYKLKQTSADKEVLFTSSFHLKR